LESSWSSSPERVEPRFGEGTPPPSRERPDPPARSLAEPRFEYAGFWQRAVALLIDWLIVVVIAMPIIVVTFGAAYFSLDPVRRSGDFAIAPPRDHRRFWRYYGATPGKLAVGVRIVDAATGARPRPCASSSACCAISYPRFLYLLRGLYQPGSGCT
jgi:hypothetical protein